MKAVAVAEFGGPEALRVISLPAPEAGPGQIRIRVTAAAVNPADVFLRSGGAAPRLRDVPPPYVPGWEAAGVVDQVGEGARTDLRPGDHAMAIVMPRGTHGAYAGLVVVAAESAARTPAGASDAEAATLPMTGLTARLALDLLGLRPGQTVVITGAAGTVGGYAVQLAKADGLHVVADASPADRHLVQALGADIVVARGPGMPGQVRDTLPAGADGLVNTVPLTAPVMRAVKDHGSIAAVRSGHPVAPERGITVHRVFVPRYASEHGRPTRSWKPGEPGAGSSSGSDGGTVPILPSSLIGMPPGRAGTQPTTDDTPQCCLREWLAQVPDPRSVLGLRHPLEYVLALAVCSLTAAGHDSPVAIAEWAAACSQATLAALGGRRDPWSGRVTPPSARTFSRVFARIDAEAFNAAVHGYLDALDGVPADPLPEVAAHEREQRRAAKAGPAPAGLLRQAAVDGKTIRGAVRPDGSQVHLLSVFDVTTGHTRAQREVDAKTNEIPELEHLTAGLDLSGTVLTLDALHTQSETARRVTEDEHGHYLMIIKDNQPSLLKAAHTALTGPDSDFAPSSWTEEGTAHGRRERRGIRTAPATGTGWPHAAQVFRIRRDTGPTHGPWTRKEIAYGITSLPASLAGSRHLAHYARAHWSIDNRAHYVRDKTFSEDQQKVRTGNQPAALAAVRNLVTGAFRHAGYANIAHARRRHSRDDQRILALYGYP